MQRRSLPTMQSNMAELNVDSRPVNELSICCWNWKGGSPRNAETLLEEAKTQTLKDELRRHEKRITQNEEKRHKAEENTISLQKLNDILSRKEQDAAQKLNAMEPIIKEEIRRQKEQKAHIKETRCSEEDQTQWLKDKICLQEKIVDDTTKRRHIIDTEFDDVCRKFIETGGKHSYPDIMLVTEASDYCVNQGEEKKQNADKEEKRTKKLKDNQSEVYAHYGGRFVAYEPTNPTTKKISATDKQIIFWSDRLKRFPKRQLQLPKPRKEFSHRLFVNVLSPPNNPTNDILVCGWHGPAIISDKDKQKTFNNMMEYVSDLCPTCDNVNNPSERNDANEKKHENCTKFAMRIVLGDFNYELVVDFETKTLVSGLKMHGLRLCYYAVNGTLENNRYDKKKDRAVIIDYILRPQSWSSRSFAVPYDPIRLGHITGRDEENKISRDDYDRLRVLSDHPPIACTLKAPEGQNLFRPVPRATENDDAGPDDQQGPSNRQQLELQETTTALQDLNLNPSEKPA